MPFPLLNQLLIRILSLQISSSLLFQSLISLGHSIRNEQPLRWRVSGKSVHFFPSWPVCMEYTPLIKLHCHYHILPHDLSLLWGQKCSIQWGWSGRWYIKLSYSLCLFKKNYELSKLYTWLVIYITVVPWNFNKGQSRILLGVVQRSNKSNRPCHRDFTN